MGALVCKVRVALLGFQRGHKWRPVMQGNHLIHGAPLQVCIRCYENGWMI